MTEQKYATPEQFKKVILRMMPEWASSIPEGKLIAGIFAQAWADTHNSKTNSREFFRNETGILEKYCDKVGLNWEQVSEMYFEHCRGAK